MTDHDADPKLRYPGLAYLLSAYFHQDWVDEHLTWEEVIDHVKAAEDPSVAAKAREDATTVLNLGLPEEGLARLFDDLRAFYYPLGDEHTYRGWLEQVAARLER